MSELSVICTCKNDNYEVEGDNTPLNRLCKSLSNNCKYLSELGLDYEYIVAEWGEYPLAKWLPLTKEFLDISNKQDRTKSVIVTQKAILQNRMNPDKFAEYFCKNVAARAATKSNILITNHDILIPEETWLEIKSLIDNDLGNFFYRSQYRNGQDINEKHLPDSYVCGGFSGDFLLIKKDLFPGYDEENDGPRLGRQSSCDGEVLYKMVKDGIRPKIIKGGYQHIDHPKTNHYDYKEYNQKGYDNPPNWGFLDFKWNKINDRVTFIEAI